VAVHRGKTFVGSADGLCELVDGRLVRFDLYAARQWMPGDADEEEDDHGDDHGDGGHVDNEVTFEPPAEIVVRRLAVLDDVLWVATDTFLWRRDATWTRRTKGRYVDLCLHEGRLAGASSRHIFDFDGQRIGRYNLAASEQDILAVASTGGELVTLHDRGLSRLVGRRFEALPGPAVPPGTTYRDVLGGAGLVVATSQGVHAWRDGRWSAIELRPGWHDVRCLARGRPTELWIGTARGAVRLEPDDPAATYRAVEYHPVGPVNDIAAADGAATIATDAGLRRLPTQP